MKILNGNNLFTTKRPEECLCSYGKLFEKPPVGPRLRGDNFTFPHFRLSPTEKHFALPKPKRAFNCYKGSKSGTPPADVSAAGAAKSDWNAPMGSIGVKDYRTSNTCCINSITTTPDTQQYNMTCRFPIMLIPYITCTFRPANYSCCHW